MEDYQKYEALKRSIDKNGQEFIEFLADTFKVYNFYDLVEEIAKLYNFRAIAFKRNKGEAMAIYKEAERIANE